MTDNSTVLNSFMKYFQVGQRRNVSGLYANRSSDSGNSNVNLQTTEASQVDERETRGLKWQSLASGIKTPSCTLEFANLKPVNIRSERKIKVKKKKRVTKTERFACYEVSILVDTFVAAKFFRKSPKG